MENLFYNTPVRYKFLKKDFTELGYIEDTVTRLALVNPDIAIKLVNLGKNIIQTTGNGNIKDVVYSVYGKEIAENIINVDYKYEDMKVTGCIGNPSIAKGNRASQLFFVNKRYVKDKTLSSAADQAFKSELPAGKYGFLILNVEIDSRKIDVNVHPAKLEIRFQDENQVFKLLYHAIKDTLALNEKSGDNGAKQGNERDKMLNSFFGNSDEINKDINPQSNTENTSNKDDLGFEFENKLTNIIEGTGNLIEDLYNSKIRQAAVAGETAEIKPENDIATIEEDEQKTLKPEMTIEQALEQSDNQNEVQEAQIENKDEDKTINDNQESESKTQETVNNENSDNSEVDKSFEEMYLKTFGISRNKKDEEEKENETAEPSDGVETININEAEQVTTLRDTNVYSKVKYKIIGFVFSSYIAIEVEDELYLINQKLANEYILYEKLRDNYYYNRNFDSQQMLLPDIIELNTKQMDIFKDNASIFARAGFDIEEFGENTIRISGAPEICIELDTKDLFLECINKMNTVARTAKQEIEEQFLKTVATKITENDKQADTFEEVDILIHKLLNLKNPFTTDEGKGIAVKFPKSEIDKKFQ